MTFEQILPALKQGEKVRRLMWKENHNCGDDYLELQNGVNAFHQTWKMTHKEGGSTSSHTNIFSANDFFADDWEVCGEENQTDKSGVSVGGLLCKVTANFEEYEQALDKFKCRLEDLREAAEELNGIKLDINIDFAR
jgi:hypothetical protein